MNEQLDQLAAVLPTMEYTLPFVGTLELTPYVFATLIFAGFIIAFKVLQVLIISRLRALSKKTETDVDDVIISAIDGIRPWVYVLTAFYIAIATLPIPEMAERVLRGFFLFAVVWQLIDAAAKFVDYASMRFLEKDEDGDGVVDPNSATASHMVTLMSRIVLWVLGVLFVLSNLGIEITSLIAGLGIGGIAIAFALQGILSDLFSSFSLYFDRPFRIGDYIMVGTDSGTVEKIGIKTTRIRTLQGEELVISNAELTTARVQNFKKMERRRIAFQFGITYETPQEKIKEINGIVERIFESLSGVNLDRVHFTTFGDSALIFDVVYFVQSSDYRVYLDNQQKFNHELMLRFAELGIEFAYPTQMIYTKNIG